MSTLRSTRRRVMSVVVLGAALALLALMVSQVGAVTTWGTLRQGTYETTQYQWTDFSRTLDISTDGGGPTTYLHTTFQSDHDPVYGYPFPYCQPKSKCPYRLGVFYERSSNAGSTWTPQYRLNPANQQGGRPTLAAEGANVYVAWEAQSSYYDSKVGSGPRVIYVITNSNYGDPASWGAPLRITSSKGRIDFPNMFAVAGKVFLTWTNANSGKVYVASSIDGGATFTKKSVGSTTAAPSMGYPYDGSGFIGKPAVASSDDGMTVGVSWFSTGKGKLVANISTDGGANWGTTPTTLANSGASKCNGYPSMDGEGTRIGFAWTKGCTMLQTTEYNGGFGTTHTAVTMPDGGLPAHVGIDGGSIALQGAGNVGLAFSACRTAGCPWSKKNTGDDEQWIESADNGATWSAVQTLNAAAVPDQVIQNDASVLFPDANTRYVHWNAEKTSFWNYQLLFKVGTS